jgi:Tfp pilus assembly protein PilN
MIQFNLLPDIKLENLKADRNRRLVISISSIVTIAAIVLAAGLFSYTEVQKSQINNLNSDIRSQGATLSSQANINSILTIQNQIQTLTNLHQQEPNVTSLATYLNQTIPVTTSLSSLTIDFNADTINMSGNADSLATVNQLVDSLKFATYSVKGIPGSKPAFSNVVLSSFGLDNSASNSVNNETASFGIDMSFDPTLFSNTETVTLSVPSKVTTRSQLDQPIQLFNQLPGNKS